MRPETKKEEIRVEEKPSEAPIEVNQVQEARRVPVRIVPQITMKMEDDNLNEKPRPIFYIKR